MINLHQTESVPVGVVRRPIGEIRCTEPPFHGGLEYTPPARGHWTIAHTPMLITGCHIIFLCASACMRGVVLTALEDGGMDRFSMILLNDHDLYDGKQEEVMLEGICEIIDGLPSRPPMVIPFTSCIHHFLACDTKYIYRELRRRYPDIDFVQGYMIPTIRKGKVSPEQQMQLTLYEALEPQETLDRHAVNVIGSNFAIDPEGDFCRLLGKNGFAIRDLVKMREYREYKDMAKSCANLYCMPVAGLAAADMEKRLGQKPLFVPATYVPEAIRQELREVAAAFQLEPLDTGPLEEEAEEALARAHRILGDIPIALDHECTPLFLSLARLLRSRGFQVKEIYSDYILPGDAENLRWLQEKAPDITFCAANNYRCRLEPRDGRGPFLAIGQKSAYYTGTAHFVNILENDGLWGFTGIRKMAERLIRAYETESNVPEIIQVKAWGCNCSAAGMHGRYPKSGGEKDSP